MSKIFIFLCGILIIASMPVQAEEMAVTDGAPAFSAAEQSHPTWTLTAGHAVGQELQLWGEKAGWKVVWNMSQDWSVPASVMFVGEFSDVAAEVIKTLASNGALIHAQFFEGNKTMVVTGAGASG